MSPLQTSIYTHRSKRSTYVRSTTLGVADSQYQTMFENISNFVRPLLNKFLWASGISENELETLMQQDSDINCRRYLWAKAIDNDIKNLKNVIIHSPRSKSLGLFDFLDRFSTTKLNEVPRLSMCVMRELFGLNVVRRQLSHEMGSVNSSCKYVTPNLQEYKLQHQEIVMMENQRLMLENLDTGQSPTSLPVSSDPQKSSPRPNNNKRLSVILSDEAERLLDYLANTQGITKSEALRKAIATESYLLEERMLGSKVFVRRKNNELMEVVFR
jgi:predicted DNA-binding protein